MNNIPTAQTIVYSSELPPGFQIGAYVIDRKLGQGGFGVTYLAHEAATDRPVVIKENFPRQCSHRDSVSLMVGPASEEQAAEFEWALDRFLDEARMLAKLSHPGIVPVLTTFEALGTAYYVMPPVPGIDIHKAAPPPDVINEEWLLPILRQLLETLEYLHSQGVLHRDIKPANILLEHDGDPVLIDFGTARALNTSYSLTLMGTPGYGPLEQFSDGDKNGPWTDLYSLGATCFRLITGNDPQRALARVVEDTLPMLSQNEELRRRFSYELLTSIDIALHMSRRERWQSARQWLSYLDTSSEQRKKEPVKPRPKSVVSKPAKPGSPKKAVGKLRRMMSNRGWLALRRKPLPVVFPNNSRSVEDSHTPEKIGRAIMGGIIGGCCGVSAGARFEVSPESGIAMAIVGVLIGAICGFISGPQD